LCRRAESRHSRRLYARGWHDILHRTIVDSADVSCWPASDSTLPSPDHVPDIDRVKSRKHCDNPILYPGVERNRFAVHEHQVDFGMRHADASHISFTDLGPTNRTGTAACCCPIGKKSFKGP